MAYIDKDLLLKDIGESVVFTVRDAETSPELRGARKIIDRIKNAPTADVEEAKHGEWIDLNITEWQCSECNYRVERWNNTPYCPHCGAKMDGGDSQ